MVQSQRIGFEHRALLGTLCFVAAGCGGGLGGADDGQGGTEGSVDGTSGTLSRDGSGGLDTGARDDSTTGRSTVADSWATGGGSGTGTLPGDSENTGEPAPELIDDAGRVAFLHYYAPVIFKRADESDSTPGGDWISNFNFDQDGWLLANNRANWSDGLKGFVDARQHQNWQIRPTLYSAVLQFEDNGRIDMVLLYHVYHASQGSEALEWVVPEVGSIHDWERVEIRINGVGERPGQGETLRYVTLTEHSNHRFRPGNHPDLHFMTTADGMHPMIFQAERTDPVGIGFGELRFVTQDFDEVMASASAVVEIAGGDPQAFHYIFSTEGDSEATAALGARVLNQCTARSLAARRADPIVVQDVSRIQFELQDLADVFVSHWDQGMPSPSWGDPQARIHLDEPILAEDGTEEIPMGDQSFKAQALDDLDDNEDRKGYPRKHWFWGLYLLGGHGAYAEGFAAPSRCIANGFPDCADRYWAQHDYFLHDGDPGDGTPEGEPGRWLPQGWSTPGQGGFDGRWHQLFADDRESTCRPPLPREHREQLRLVDDR